jgi:flagellar hook-length control protein FliK
VVDSSGVQIRSYDWGLTADTAASRAAGDGLFQSSLAGSAGGQSTGEAIARQLEQKLLYSARRGVHRLRMNLSPESLGRLDVELKVKDGQLVAFIKAESEEAYAALEGEMGALKDALAAEGLELVMTLSYEGSAAGGEGRQAPGQGAWASGGGADEYFDDDDNRAERPDGREAERLFDRMV